jgi:hypothetical protein
VSLITLKKLTLIVIAIIVATVIGFAVWTITPYFTNTTIDEPLPTSSLEVPTVVEKQEMIRVSTNVTDNDEDLQTSNLMPTIFILLYRNILFLLL